MFFSKDAGKSIEKKAVFEMMALLCCDATFLTVSYGHPISRFQYPYKLVRRTVNFVITHA
jgi:hypothetical protein